MDDANEQDASPDEFLRKLTSGNPARPLRERELAALEEYQPLKSRLIAGDNSAFRAFQKVANELLAIRREIHGSQVGYFDFLDEVKSLTKIAQENRQKVDHWETEPPDVVSAKNMLGLWLALELRRARAAFDKTRKEQDADFETKGMRKTGVRVKLTLKSASEICVALADATITKAGEFQSELRQLEEAETAVLAFTREVAGSAIPLAYFVSGETGLGASAVNAATERGEQLCRDIEGAFQLAKAQKNQHTTSRLNPIAGVVLSTRSDWSLNDAITWTCDRNEDRVNNPAFRVDNLTAAELYDTGNPILAAAKSLLDALRSGSIPARRLNGDGTALPITAGYWNNKSATDLQRPCEQDVIVPSEDVKRYFPTEKMPAQSIQASIARQHAERNFKRKFDDVNAKFLPQGPPGSRGYYWTNLIDEADGEAHLYWEKLIALGTSPQLAAEQAIALFDNFESQIRSVLQSAVNRKAGAVIVDRQCFIVRARLSKLLLIEAPDFVDYGLPTILPTQTPANKNVTATTKGKKGRKPGSGSMAKADAPFLIEMEELIQQGKAFSADGAAKLVAHKAPGNATEASKATRLANRYRASDRI